MNLEEQIRGLPSVKDATGDDLVSREVVLALIVAQQQALEATRTAAEGRKA